jgi:CRISPR system Cascade subunit CasE
MKYLSRIRLRENASDTLVFWNSLKDAYSYHKTIWNLFSDDPNKKRDFLYRIDSTGRTPVIYTVSSNKPVDSFEIWDIESKHYSPVLRQGQKLGFTMRVNPIVSRRDEQGRQHRHDVIMDAKMRLRNETVKPGDQSLADVIYQEGMKWLESRCVPHGFSVSTKNVMIEGYQQFQFSKQKGGHEVRISTLDYSGILEVTQPDYFLNSLYEGIGPAKGFGCGLLMVRPIS